MTDVALASIEDKLDRLIELMELSLPKPERSRQYTADEIKDGLRGA